MADAHVSGACGEIRGGSNPLSGTSSDISYHRISIRERIRQPLVELTNLLVQQRQILS